MCGSCAVLELSNHIVEWRVSWIGVAGFKNPSLICALLDHSDAGLVATSSNFLSRLWTFEVSWSRRRRWRAQILTKVLEDSRTSMTGTRSSKPLKSPKKSTHCSGRRGCIFFNVARTALKFCNTRWLDFRMVWSACQAFIWFQLHLGFDTRSPRMTINAESTTAYKMNV